MFGRKTGSPSANIGNIDCLIGAKTRIEGNTEFEGGLRVDGQIKGNLKGGQNSMLVVSEHAQLEGELHVAHAVINGKVVGTIFVGERLELQPKARITGDVHYQTLEMHPGAVVEGRLMYHSGEAAPETIIPLDIEPSSSLKKNRQAA